MRLLNTPNSYGLVTKLFHWLSVPIVIGMFALGLWMHELDYDHPWYISAPHIHRSIGVLFISFTLLRFIWRFKNKPPASISTHKPWEKTLAKAAQYCMYAILFLMLPTGYLITTAKGQGLDVFNWFTIPPLITNIDNLESIVGEIHEILAFSLICIISVHALAGLKHHFFDKDSTLKRMLSNFKP